MEDTGNDYLASPNTIKDDESPKRNASKAFLKLVPGSSHPGMLSKSAAQIQNAYDDSKGGGFVIL